MDIRSRIIAEARSWIGTPWRHQARLKGVGCDCVGLVIGVYVNVGLWPEGLDFTGYSRVPHPETMERLILHRGVEIPPAEVLDGDVYWFRYERQPKHLGLVAGTNLIHAYAPAGRVVEHILDERWQRRIHKAFRLRDLGA